ncbi:SDR family NAD(P)-dependent oxidoreductase [Rhodococcus rhodochrous]|uniref:Oxidoreductase n=1 Tax=Rhodococcus rhodochrous KG-21 TaxID=1441923 RepID=A0A0M8PTD7_RHORH|nr:SDR family oxidoreductase [Rhodococcus rhodochrous]KOS58188.1 oxidoreductase [Rhodococcus rhodochrous KG-21]
MTATTTPDRPTALVTGAGRGIGRAIVLRLAQEGYACVVVDLDADAAEKVAAEVGGRAVGLDVTDSTAVSELAVTITRLDALVNNAGIFPPAPIAEVPLEQFRAVMDVNVLGPLNLIQAFLPQLGAARGAVVNIASTAAKAPVPGTAAYSPSKAALISLTKLCAVELASTGVRFNAIGPGGVQTEGTASVSADPEREARFNALLPVGRRALPDDIADVVPFLVGPDARYVTGQVIYVDGGLTESTISFLRAAQRG